MELGCEYCGKKFRTKQNLQYHTNNKVCLKTNKTCSDCGHQFKNIKMLEYHIENKVCQKKTIKQKIQFKKEFQKQYENYTKDDLILELASMSGEVKALKENPQTQNNIEKQQINNIYIQVPPAFLTLDTFPTLMKMLPDLLPNALSKHPTEFISFLIKETNCNPERPIFNSAQITNKKDPYAKISDGKKYIYAPKKQVISELIENKKSLLQEYVDKNGDKYGEKILKRYYKYIDLLDEDSETVKDLEIKITCMLLNMMEVIGSDEWSKNLLEDLQSYDNE